MAVKKNCSILFPMLITEPSVSGLAVCDRYGFEETELT
jgi:hypothetical protein